jgi:hypothetical protein
MHILNEMSGQSVQLIDLYGFTIRTTLCITGQITNTSVGGTKISTAFNESTPLIIRVNWI